MKTILMASLVLTSLASASLFATEIEGTYKAKRPVFAVGYTKKGCLEDHGTYQGDGVCRFEDGGAETVISADERTFHVVMSSVGTNMHTCDYSGTALLTADNKLISNDKNDGGECELAITFTSKDTIAVETNGKCQEYCGANMSLDEEKLTREK